MLTPFLILVVLALLFTVASLVWPQKNFLLPVAVLLVAISLLIAR